MQRTATLTKLVILRYDTPMLHRTWS